MRATKLITTLLITILYFDVVGFSTTSVIGLIGAFILLASKRKLWFD